MDERDAQLASYQLRNINFTVKEQVADTTYAEFNEIQKILGIISNTYHQFHKSDYLEANF